MANFPLFNSSYNNYRNYYSRYSNYYNRNKRLESLSSNTYSQENTNIESKPNQEDNVQVSKDSKTYEKRSSNYNSFGPIHFNFDSFYNSEEPVIEFMGLKLFLDDLIIIGILFFLYEEDVKDDLLFISLILLLLS